MMYVVGFLLLLVVLQMSILIYVCNALLASLHRDLERPIFTEDGRPRLAVTVDDWRASYQGCSPESEEWRWPHV